MSFSRCLDPLASSSPPFSHLLSPPQDWTPADGSLVPHKDAPGTNLVYNQGGFFIVCSDLSCYLQTQSLKRGDGIEIWVLQPACQGRDHYLSDKGNPPNIYIIKGDSHWVVKDLTTDAEPQVHELHPNCRGGDQNMDCGSWFYIFFLEQGVMHRVLDMSTDEKGGDTLLKPECCKGSITLAPFPSQL
ncbi:mucin-2-like [Platysternon megacephalum]|uniref:Mucin-2-like n=1 Tax=Platysternon megacephalum TaxID=55544 RepID=A0A4D9DK31_9SAUR|nr:mucin-2-like [Platysternon megacephalum]